MARSLNRPRALAQERIGLLLCAFQSVCQPDFFHDRLGRLVYKDRPMRKISDNHEEGRGADPVVERIAGVILAGGRSSRYGVNKAFVQIEGVSLIERAVRSLRRVFERIILITNTPEEHHFMGLPMHEDLVKGLGPMGGIYTGLEKISEEAGFFVACDMPFINPRLVRYMTQIGKGFDAVVPRVGWMLEPLHALYTRDCLPAIRGLIDSNEYQIVKAFPKIRVRYVDEEEIRSVDRELKSFLNINRPEDLGAAGGWKKARPKGR